MLYFAYGSNLLPAQVLRRCPGAQRSGHGALQNWRLILTTRGTANIVRKRGAVVHGGLWTFMPHHLALMDQWEGVARGANRRVWIKVATDNGTQVTAVTYVSRRTYPSRGKAHYVLNTMVPGAKAFGLPDYFIDEIRSWLPHRCIASSQPYRGYRARSMREASLRSAARIGS